MFVQVQASLEPDAGTIASPLRDASVNFASGEFESLREWSESARAPTPMKQIITIGNSILFCRASVRAYRCMVNLFFIFIISMAYTDGFVDDAESIMCILSATAFLKVAMPSDAISGLLPGYACDHSLGERLATADEAR